MFKKKSHQFKDSPNKSKSDQVLWFIENYLPQKKERASSKELSINSLKPETIKNIRRFTSFSPRIFPTSKNTKISFTFGNWALPYFKLLKKIGIVK